jgi:hypothetical protein
MLEENMLYIIYNKLNFKYILMLKKITLYNRDTINCYPRYCNAIQIMSSNYIKYWWLCLKFKNKYKNKIYTLCTIKNNKFDDNNIFIYTHDHIYNIQYNNICKKYIKSYTENCILSCYQNIFKRNNYDKLFKNFIKPVELLRHPYSQINEENIIFTQYKYIKTNNISFNILRIKNILFYNYNF